MIFYVSINAKPNGTGKKDRPFNRIQQAANIAKSGDEIVVAPGVYRECVIPQNAGTEDNPIVYRAEKFGKSIITGSEPIKCWTKYQGNVWNVTIPNGIFGSYNPYQEVLYGDWYYTREKLHAGEVYLNGKSMYEVDSLDKVIDPSPIAVSNEKSFSVYQWYVCQKDNATLIFANFQGKDPNKETVEISVRRNCFYPEKTGIDYITVQGFCICNAATTWAPPTAYQEGMIGPHWAKGWVIENCEIFESKCVGISLGKYLQEGNDNKWTKTRFKQGTQTERDAICQAQAEGWTKERIGSHVIRNCHIHDCGQAGIVGHLGGVFSIIENNRIDHINWKHNFSGAEIGGIKLHAAIDVQIICNHIHHCTRGIWLDWQAQGTRVSRNLFHDNFPPEGTTQFSTALDIGEDLFVEVSHGPTLVDHNIFLSPNSCRIQTQGLAFVHNLICGAFTSVGEGGTNTTPDLKKYGELRLSDTEPRYTPYHFPHRTEIKGFMSILHGDNRFYNNIFVQKNKPGTMDFLYKAVSANSRNSIVGLSQFDDYPTWEEYKSLFFREDDVGAQEDISKFFMKLPIYAGGNLYFNGARPWKKEQSYRAETNRTIIINFEVAENGCYLKTDLVDMLEDVFDTGMISTEVLGEAFEPEQKYENPDGSSILFDEDYFGNKRSIHPTPGPFESEIGWAQNMDLSNIN